MVRFQREPATRSTPDYSSRRVQYRLLALVCSLMLVVVLIGEAAKPATWRRMFADEAASGDPSSRSAHPVEDADIDTRLSGRDPGPLPSDVFVIRDGRVSLANAEPGATPPDSGGLLGIDSQRWDAVQDDTVFQSSESPLWYDTLAALRGLGPGDLRSAPANAVGFTQLFRQPAAYRGKLVDIVGTVRRAHRIAARPNDRGIASYWQCWLFPDGSPNPMVVYALEMPPGFPQGMTLSESVSFRGVFFKRWAYAAPEGIRTAPLVLSLVGRWEPAPAGPAMKRLPGRSTILTALVCLALGSGLLAYWIYRNSLRIGGPAARRAELIDVPEES